VDPTEEYVEMTVPSTPAGAVEHVDVVLRVNGIEHTLALDTRTTLLDALRERLGLFGTKKGCDRGECGACTVLENGRRINSCLTFAVMHNGTEITTIEGLAAPASTGAAGLPADATLHPVQQAFIQYDAFQCGYCTPGQILSAVALLAEGHTSSDTEIREWMSGNICRCSAYPNIVAAIRAVANGEVTSTPAGTAPAAPSPDRDAPVAAPPEPVLLAGAGRAATTDDASR
jgi:xanthine dehydrogenase YagT iron-sulfur-binding subunit